VVERESEDPAARVHPGQGRDPWLRFALLFAALAIASEVVYYGFALESELFRAYLEALAKVSGVILSQLTDGIVVRGTIISGDLFSVQIAEGCDAYRICALLCSAMLAFPAPLPVKAWGLVLGLVWLNLLNFVRIVGLFFIGGYFHSIFQRSHEVYFPIFLICMTVLAWIVWVRRATRVALEAPPHPA
jgi:exosortase/archaeosortase family protein